MVVDSFGNRVGLIEPDDNTPLIMWSSHTDTVHHLPGTQPLSYDANLHVVSLSNKAKSNCLGADCTTGVWLMREMYLAKMPGLYVWHAEEEIKCRGAEYLIEHNPLLFDGVQAAIAFDRRGYNDIITHQLGTRTASDKFANSLASALTSAGLPGLVPSDNGTYTDTERYTKLIGECTNISVGYFNAHSSAEWQNVAFAYDLRCALLKLDLSSLTFHRKPGEVDPDDYSGYKNFYSGSNFTASIDTVTRYVDDFQDMIRICRSCPAAMASLLRSLGYNARELEDEVSRYYTRISAISNNEIDEE